MSTEVVFHKEMDFVEGLRENKLQACPTWLNEVFNNEYSPFKIVLHEICPKAKVIISIRMTVENEI